MNDDIDPLKSDLWITDMMGIEAHFFPRGEKESMCGFPWTGFFWTVEKEQPKNKVCAKCLELKAKGPGS